MTDERKKSYKALGDMMEELQNLNLELNPSPEPDEFSINQYAGANALTREKARGILDRGVREKKLTVRKIGNHSYYSRVET